MSIKDIPNLFCAEFLSNRQPINVFSGLELTSTIHASIIIVLWPHNSEYSFGIDTKNFKLKSYGNNYWVIGATLIIMENLRILVLAELRDLLIFECNQFGLYLVLVKPLMSKYLHTVIKWVFHLNLWVLLPFGIYEIQDVNWEMNNEIISKLVCYFLHYLLMLSL